MKKIIIAVLIFAGSSSAFAQSQKLKLQSQQNDTKQIGVEMTAKNETDKMAKALNLTPDQKTKIHAVNLNTAQNTEYIKQAGPNAGADRMTYVIQNKNNQYKNILTAEQYAKYEKIANGPATKGGSANSSN
jgi:Spy/CpxP family protein refolding chaperone